MKIKKSSSIIPCLRQLMKIKKYWDKGICDKTLYYLFIKYYPNQLEIGIDMAIFLSTISRKYGTMLDDFVKSSNQIGLFRYNLCMECPYDKKRRPVKFSVSQNLVFSPALADHSHINSLAYHVIKSV